MRVATYERLSKALDGEQTATVRQRKDNRAYAGIKGWTVAADFEDVDFSAYRKGDTRPGYTALLAAIEAGEVDAVLVWKLDRLVRRAADFERFWAVCERHGVVLASATEPIDTSTDLGMVIVRILVSFAQLESATMSLRIRRSKEEHARAGQPHHGGKRAFGLTADWSDIVPAEADLIRQAARDVVAGRSLRSICMEWNQAGVQTATGSYWRHQGLTSMLKSPRLIGKRDYKGEIVADGTWPAILDERTWRRVRAVLADPRRRVYRAGHSYLLSGLVVCGRCEARTRLKGGLANNGSRRYVCPPKPEGCNGIGIKADDIEGEVVERVFAALEAESVKPTRADRRSEERALERAIAEAEGSLEQLSRDHYVERRISRAEFLAARDGLEQRLAAGRRRLVQLAPLTAPRWSEAKLRQRWHRMDEPEQRGVLAGLIDTITVGPVTGHRNVFDPERISVTWRY